jgi:hypothetical protein
MAPPAGPALGRAVRPDAGQPVLVDPGAERTEDGRQQRQRGHHHQADRERRGDADPADELDPGQEQPADREHDRPAGEHDRVPGLRHRPADRGLDRVARGQLLPVAGDDEQRVVDPGAEAQHRRDHRRGRMHLEQRGPEVDH